MVPAANDTVDVPEPVMEVGEKVAVRAGLVGVGAVTVIIGVRATAELKPLTAVTLAVVVPV